MLARVRVGSTRRLREWLQSISHLITFKNDGLFGLLRKGCRAVAACCIGVRTPDTSLRQPPDAVGSPRSVDGAPTGTAVQTCGVFVVVAAHASGVCGRLGGIASL